MGTHGHEHEIVEPKKFELPGNFIPIVAVLLVIGGISFAGAFAYDAKVAWKGFIIGWWFTLGLGLIGPFFVSIMRLASAGWDVPIRRIAESFGYFLPVSLILGVVGAFAIPPEIFTWQLEAAQQDPILSLKLGFLDKNYFIASTAGSLALMCGLFFWMRSLSLKQDETGEWKLTEEMQRISALYVLSFILTVSFNSWYWLMSLEPNWFSTMWSVYTFAGMFQCGLALLYILSLTIGRKGYLGSFYGGRQIHDLGKMVFGFTVFYAYIGFSQFLLIWYANIPEEDVWFLQRIGISGDEGWLYFTLFIPFFKFIIPFLIMLPQAIKKNKDNIMFYLCMWLIGMQLYEVWFWVEPEPHGYPALHAGHEHVPHGPDLVAMLLEFGVAMAFIGAFVFVAGRAMSSASMVPLKDPFLHETLPHHTHEPTIFEIEEAREA